MRLTLHTDYALRVLIYLNAHPQRLCSISEISRAYGVSHNHMMKVVNALAKAGFVAAVRGRGGGVRLARPATETSIGSVVREMEDGFELVDCASCVIAPGCGLTRLLGQASAAFLAVLDNCTLAELPDGPASLLALWHGQDGPDDAAAQPA